ncbi:hypothetical protein FOA52_000601 [Chlamydomonas sp. UWO 241]|nr:hypothetical protein FOA52_000601 [Chlamydomonas sp. UWO 241]
MTDFQSRLLAALPADLGSQGHNVAVLQEALDKLDAFQGEAQAALFRLLARTAADASVAPHQLSAALAPLADSAYLLPQAVVAELLPHVQSFREINTQVATLEAQVTKEKEAANVHAHGAEFDCLMLRGCLGDAAWAVVSMRKALAEEEERASAGQAVLSAPALAALQACCQRCDATLEGALDAAFSDVLRVDAARRTLTARATLPPALPGGPPVLASELWAGLGVRGELGTRMSRTADALLHGVLEPVLAGHLCVSEEGVDAGVDSTLGPGAGVLSWAAPQAGAAPHAPEACCQKVLKLVAEAVFAWDEELLCKWGEVFWVRMADAYVRLHAGPYVRAAGGDTAVASAKAEAARSLEEFAESLGCVDEPYLGPAVDALAEQTLSAQQQMYLERARTLILGGGDSEHRSGDTGHATAGEPLVVDTEYCARLAAGRLPDWEMADPPAGMSTADSPPLAGGTYGVSRHTLDVSLLINEALSHAGTCGDASVARALVGAVPKIAVMARILPDRGAMQQTPLLALLHHNDLVHLAATLSLCGALHGPELSPLLGAGALDFSAEAALLRSAAEEVLSAQVESQQRELASLLDGLGHLRSIADGKSGITNRKAVRQLLHSLARLGRLSRSVLSPPVFVRVAAELLRQTCTSFVNDVVAKRDIGIDDAKELRDLLGPVADEALPALLGLPPPGTPGQQQHGQEPALSGVPLAVLSAAVAARCTPLRKLRSLIGLLDSGMVVLVDGWCDGALARDGWGRTEVERVLCALFQDSEYRHMALARVRTAKG